jgi:hypothetical protein
VRLPNLSCFFAWQSRSLPHSPELVLSSQWLTCYLLEQLRMFLDQTCPTSISISPSARIGGRDVGLFPKCCLARVSTSLLAIPGGQFRFRGKEVQVIRNGCGKVPEQRQQILMSEDMSITCNRCIESHCPGRQRSKAEEEKQYEQDGYAMVGRCGTSHRAAHECLVRLQCMLSLAN